MMYNFLEIFGEYIATEKYRNMLKNTMFTDLVINKEDLHIKALLHVDIFDNIMCLKAVANEIKAALKFKSVEFEYVLPPEALTEKCFPMLLKVVRVNVPQTNGFLTSIETKHLIHKGFEPNNIHNPYIYEMWQKNKFKLGEHITSIDAAFYIVPMVNAVQRSGTIEEKELLFKSMLKYEAFEVIPSTKRGCKGQTERLVEQAVRMSTNVKNRQTRAQDASMEYLENRIEKENMMNRKVLLFTLEPGKVDKNIAGLIANKISAKYQRPSCMLTKVGDVYQGSARGYEMSGVTNFKDICDETGCVNWTAGHQNAFGISINADKIEEFLEKTDIALANMASEPVYYVDYIYNGADVNPQDILAISDLSDLWGKDMDEAMVAVKDIKISKELVVVYRKTSNTLKITLPNKVSLMKFNATDEECEMLENQTGAYIQMDIVGKCHKNEWMGNVSPQIFIEDWEVTGQGKYLF